MSLYKTFLILAIVIGYLVGTVSWAYIIGKFLWKEDIRTKGSGNSGASNMAINHGWKYGIVVFILDFLKTILVMKIFAHLGLNNGLWYQQILAVRAVAGFASVIGHIFPFWLNFKGGKGSASAIALGFGLDPFIGLAGAITIILVSIITNYVSLGGIFVWLGLAASSWIVFHNIYITGGFIIMFFLSLYLHRNNLKRIKAGTESGIKRKYDDNDKKLK